MPDQNTLRFYSRLFEELRTSNPQRKAQLVQTRLLS
jgi:hypothetical protein